MIGFSLFFINLHLKFNIEMRYWVAKFKIIDKNCDKVGQFSTLQSSREILAAIAGEAGFESFEETEEGINGYVQISLFNKEVLDASLENFPIEGVLITYQLFEAEDKDWNQTWEENGFDPIIINDKCVIHDTIHTYHGKPCDLDIVIDAKQAFGTGTHETTKMIVSELLDLQLNDKRVLDCGCGTGILSLVASKCGAKSVVAYDIDEWSVNNSLHNAEINNVNNMEVLLGDTCVLSHVSGVFDVVLANINRNILLNDMKQFKSVMGPESTLIISGFYEEDKMLLAHKAGELGLKLNHSRNDNNWCMLSFENA